jgi:hypothetical protein
MPKVRGQNRKHVAARGKAAVLEDFMIESGWKNKGGTAELPQCGCGTWKQHWINVSGKKWPAKCAVDGCENSAEVGAHIRNSKVEGVQIAPFCKECNAQGTDTEFTLKDDVKLVSANRAQTCDLAHIKEAVCRKY